jgi:hypothetical protein
MQDARNLTRINRDWNGRFTRAINHRGDLAVAAYAAGIILGARSPRLRFKSAGICCFCRHIRISFKSYKKSLLIDVSS